MSTMTSLQELLQCEEDSFIPDELDDKLYNDHTYNWEVMFETVKLFLMKEGRWPRGAREEDKRDVIMADGSIKSRDLAMWMATQRQNKFKGKLLYERERKLDSIRFMWDKYEHEWHAMFCAVKRFKEKEGRWPRKRKADDKREVVLADGKPVLRDLAKWMGTQKTDKSNGKLIQLREEKLKEIGFVWDKFEFEWNAMFCAVKRFKEIEGRWPRCDKAEDKREVVLADGKPVLKDLAKWMNRQKNFKSNGKLISLREKKLNSIGFVWDEKEHNWKVMFAALKSFKEKEGRWPRLKKAEDKREVVLADGKPVLRDLAEWMHNQKIAKRNGKLIPLREKKLREMDFPFHVRRKRKRQADPSTSSSSSSSGTSPDKKRIIITENVFHRVHSTRRTTTN